MKRTLTGEQQEEGTRKYQRYDEDDEDDTNLCEWAEYFEGKRTRPQKEVQYIAQEVRGTLGKGMICEISPPSRLIPTAMRQGFAQGWSLDASSKCPVTNRCWDITDKDEQSVILRMLRRDRPYAVVMTPSLQRCEKSDEEQWRFMLEVAARQHQAGRYFVITHTSMSTAWDDRRIRAFMKRTEASITELDMCGYGLKANNNDDEAKALEQIKLLTNMPSAVQGMARQCRGGHRHGQVTGAQVSMAAKGTRAYYNQLGKCFDAQWHIDQGDPQLHNLDAWDVDTCHEEERGGEPWGQYVDDRTGKSLKPKEVRAARKREIDTLVAMGVYEVVPRSKAHRSGQNIIQTRWLDVDKSTSPQKCDVRSRCVAKEFATTSRDDVFAATPALEGVKIMMSLVASSNEGWCPSQRIMVMDIKRAFLYAPIHRELYIELPDEANPEGARDVVGRLHKAMYGTRDAPLCWQRHVAEALTKMGFEKGTAQQCILLHRARDLRMAFHVDDFMVTGDPAQLEWMRAEVQKTASSSGIQMGSPTRPTRGTSTRCSRSWAC